MKNRVDRIEDKVDLIDSRLDSIDKTLIINTQSLQQHMKRSDALENIVLPMKAKWDMVEGALKFIGIVATIGGLAAALVEIIQFFRK